MSDPTNRFHPSTMTNNNSFKGVEITTGGSWSIPTDVEIDATIMSIARNGRNKTVPI
jgi:hypothetical protein